MGNRGVNIIFMVPPGLLLRKCPNYEIIFYPKYPHSIYLLSRVAQCRLLLPPSAAPVQLAALALHARQWKVGLQCRRPGSCSKPAPTARASSLGPMPAARALAAAEWPRARRLQLVCSSNISPAALWPDAARESAGAAARLWQRQRGRRQDSPTRAQRPQMAAAAASDARRNAAAHDWAALAGA